MTLRFGDLLELKFKLTIQKGLALKLTIIQIDDSRRDTRASLMSITVLYRLQGRFGKVTVQSSHYNYRDVVTVQLTC